MWRKGRGAPQLTLQSCARYPTFSPAVAPARGASRCHSRPKSCWSAFWCRLNVAARRGHCATYSSRWAAYSVAPCSNPARLTLCVPAGASGALFSKSRTPYSKYAPDDASGAGRARAGCRRYWAESSDRPCWDAASNSWATVARRWSDLKWPAWWCL